MTSEDTVTARRSRRRAVAVISACLLLSAALAASQAIQRDTTHPRRADTTAPTANGKSPETAQERLRRLLPSAQSESTPIARTSTPTITLGLLTQTRHDGHAGLFAPRPDAYRPVAIVLHATGSGSAGSEFASLAALGAYFQRAGVASSHFAVDRDGQIMQYVHEDQAAFHVSRPGWNGVSIGIELLNDNTGTQPFTDAQIHAARQLVRYLGSKYGIPVEAVVRHRDIQPEDRSDPATNLDWEAFSASLADPTATAKRERRTEAGARRLDASTDAPDVSPT